MPPHRLREVVEIVYTNYRGVRAHRRILPQQIWFGKNQWHPQDQWLLEAFDLGKQAIRTFSMKNIHSWRPDAMPSSVDRAKEMPNDVDF